MRTYEETLREAKLLASSPETIAAYLEKRGRRLAADRFLDEGDEELEKALLAVNHPLVDLSLARHCRFAETARLLFFREPASLALKLAVLANRVVGGSAFSYFLKDLFEQDEGKLSSYLASASDEELYALFENPKINDSFLRDFLEGKACWRELSEARRMTALVALHRNERMKTPYDRSFMDGYAEYNYGAVFDAAWKLAERLPITPQWASVLHWLYVPLQPDAFSVKEPLEVAARWFPQTPEQVDQEEQRLSFSPYRGVRRGLAKLALSKSSTLAPKLFESDDVAFRCAAYAYADLSVEQISSAYERDGELAFEEMVHNQDLWKREATRIALHAVAWSVVNNDKHSDLMAANVFNGVRDRFAKSHPDWFRDEENFTPEPSEEPATKSDIEALASRLSGSASTVQQMKTLLETINGRVGFVWWFSLGTLIGIFSHKL